MAVGCTFPPLPDLTDATPRQRIAFNQDSYGITDNVLITGATASVTGTIQNTGETTLAGIQVMVSEGGSEFSIATTCPDTLTALATCSMTVTLDPATVGPKVATLRVSSTQGESDAATVSGMGAAAVAVTISATGTTGRVTSSPPGIDCTVGTCVHEFTTTSVVLTATDDGNGTLADWGEATCPATTSCSLPLTMNRSLTADFRAPVSNPIPSTVAGAAAFDPDGSLLVVTRNQGSSTMSMLRLAGSTLTLLDSGTLGAAARTGYDLSVATNRVITVVGAAEVGTAFQPFKTEIHPDLSTETGNLTVSSPGDGASRGVCHDATNRAYVVGSVADAASMFWANALPGASNWDMLRNTAATAEAGVARDVAWSTSGFWVVGETGAQGWLGRIDGSDGSTVAETIVPGAAVLTAVAIHGPDIIVAGRQAGTNAPLIRRYTGTLGEAWSRVLSGTADSVQVVVDAPSGATYVASTSSVPVECSLHKIDGSTGAIVWSRMVSTGSCTALAVNADGVAVIAATSGSALARKYFH